MFRDFFLTITLRKALWSDSQEKLEIFQDYFSNFQKLNFKFKKERKENSLFSSSVTLIGKTE